MRRQRMRILVLVCLIGLMASGCAPDSGSGSSERLNKEISAKADAAIDKIVGGEIETTGPNGSSGTPASELTLSDAEVNKIKSRKATAAIVMHYSGNAWARAQVAGLKQEFGRLGIRVVAVTSANFDAGEQTSQIDTLLAKKPDIIVSIPADPVATAGAYQRAARQGVHLVFMDNVPEGMRAGQDYVSVVSSANYENGVISAHQMAKHIGGSGEVGMISHQTPFFVTDQREQGFKETIKREYPDIELVEEQGIAGPDFSGDAQAAANAMLTKNPDLDGIWAVWAIPGEGVMAAARAAGRSDLVITTVDLEEPVGIALASDELVTGLSSQMPFDQGVAEAKLAGYALIGKDAPPFVVVPPLPVEHDNVLKAWEAVYHEPPPADLKKSSE